MHAHKHVDVNDILYAIKPLVTAYIALSVQELHNKVVGGSSRNYVTVTSGRGVSGVSTGERDKPKGEGVQKSLCHRDVIIG